MKQVEEKKVGIWRSCDFPSGRSVVTNDPFAVTVSKFLQVSLFLERIRNVFGQDFQQNIRQETTN